MRSRILASMLLSFLAACGTQPETVPPHPLVGTWGADIDVPVAEDPAKAPDAPRYTGRLHLDLHADGSAVFLFEGGVPSMDAHTAILPEDQRWRWRATGPETATLERWFPLDDPAQRDLIASIVKKSRIRLALADGDRLRVLFAGEDAADPKAGWRLPRRD